MTTNGAITITRYTGSGPDVSIPSSINGLPVISIGDSAFYDCYRLTSVAIPNTVTSIGTFAFSYCTSLTNVTIPDSVTNIGPGAFADCTALNAISVDALNPTYTSVEGVLFNKKQTTLLECPGAKTLSYRIPGTVTNIGDYAFYLCGSLLRVTVPDSVQRIGDHAFDGCSVLSLVTIGQGLASIGDFAFNYCPALKGMIFYGNAPGLGSQVFSWGFPIVYYMPGSTGWRDSGNFGGCLTELWAPQTQFNYTTNNGCACPGQGSTVTITGYTGPGGDVVIPSIINGLPVTSIGDAAFEYSRLLFTIAIPDGITNIGSLAFHASPYLMSVAISSTVSNIGNLAFNYCRSLTEIAVDPLNPAYSSLDGVLFDKHQTTLIHFPGGKAGNYTIPNGVVSGVTAFDICDHLISIAIPNSLTNIGTEPFYGCSRLSAITVDDLNPVYSSVDGVLFDKSKTRLVEYPPSKEDGVYTIPGSVCAIEEAAFSGCGLLRNLTIPDSVTSIGVGAFGGCGLTNVVIPNSVTNLGGGVFFQCLNLNSVTIGSGVTCIPAMAFQNCVVLTSVSIGNRVTTIEWSAFDRCGFLTTISIPARVSDVGPLAFRDCTSLSGIYFWGNAPPQAQDVLLNDNSATVYYLQGTTGWGSTFGGRPTAPWVLPNPVILSHGSAAGVQTNGFGFIISWATNASVVVEVATDLLDASWFPISTQTLASGSAHFTDPQWTNYPARFYRLRSP